MPLDKPPQQQTQGNIGDDVESEAEGSGVGASSQNKIMLVVLLTIFVSVVVYFMFLRDPSEDDQEPANELVIEGSGAKPVKDKNVDYNASDILEVIPNNDFFTPKVQDTTAALPELPTLPDNVRQQIVQNIKKNDTYTKEEVDKMVEDKVSALMKEQMGKLSQQNQNTAQQRIIGQDIVVAPDKSKKDGFDPNAILAANTPTTVKLASDGHMMTGAEILAEQEKEEKNEIAKIQRARALKERQSAPMFKLNKGVGPANSTPQDSESIILSFTDNKLDVKNQTPDVVPTQVTDLTRVILQGKVLNAVLETAIDTDIASTVRAVITRDIFAEEGKNVLIPRGSRVIGTYGTDVKAGQTKVTITWNRIIRVDGMSLNITSVGADRLGRAGVVGELDNRYAQKLANSFLSSVLTVGTAIAAEKVSGSTGITTTVSSLTGDTTQTSGKTSDYALVDATKQFMNDAKEIVDDIAEQKPVIRIPQGEKILIMVTQDITLPVFKRSS